MGSVSLSFSVSGHLRLKEQLDLLKLSGREQKALLRALGKQVISFSRANIRKQTTVDGSPMTPRKDNRDRRRMLKKLARALGVYSTGTDSVKVTSKNKLEAIIGAKHQEGTTERWTAEKAARAYGKPDYSAPATRKQASSLLRQGYRRPTRSDKKGGTRRVTAKWIQENMTLGQAGLILRHLREVELGKEMVKGAWDVVLPARPFLGANVAQREEMLTSVARQMISNMKVQR